MGQPVLWKSPAIPDKVLEEELCWAIRARIDELSVADEMSTSDLLTLFTRYNLANPVERDAIDSAFVWMTGYTFATICAMVVTPNGKDFERTLEKWRKAGS